MTTALWREVTAIPLLTIEIPHILAWLLAWLASEQNKSLEQVAIEQLEPLLEPATEDLKELEENLKDAHRVVVWEAVPDDYSTKEIAL